MKKLINVILILLCILSLSACDNKSMNYIIQNKPSIKGLVKETNNNSILITSANEEYVISLNVENKDSMTHFDIGDEVIVYYDGNILETYPMQINKVYAITLNNPANRDLNNQN